MRITNLQADGTPATGSEDAYVTDALVTCTPTPVYADGDELEQKNACGEVVVNFVGDDSFKRIDLAIQVATPDPYLATFLSTGSTIEGTGADAGRIGFKAPPIGVVSSNGVSIELWAKRIDDGVLDADSPYFHVVFPRVKNLRMGDWVHGNQPWLPNFSGRAYENPNFYDGGFNDVGYTADRVMSYFPTATLPTASCGPIATEQTS